MGRKRRKGVVVDSGNGIALVVASIVEKAIVSWVWRKKRGKIHNKSMRQDIIHREIFTEVTILKYCSSIVISS